MQIYLMTEQGSRPVEFQPGQSLLEVLRPVAGQRLHTPCGGQGTCKKCTVFLADAQGEHPVLACRTEAKDGMYLRIPEESPLHVTLAGADGDCFPTDPGQTGYGIACDIGTTTVVCRLVELSTGRTMAVAGEGNAQRAYGADVITRIKASMDGQRPALTAAIRGQLSRMIRELSRSAGIPLDAVRAMSVAGNTTMCHLLAGLSPDGIGAAPFTPESLFGDTWDAEEFDLPFAGEVYITPCVSGYVGGDITADLLAAELDRAEQPILLIDVGTNGEMALGCGDRFVCCSTAAGPAFEGAEIHCGMTAAPGAISEVRLKGDQILCKVLGGGEARGICGSGLIDAVAVMLEKGAVDETGRMLDVEEDDIPPELEPYLFLLEDEPAFLLSGEVCVTQSDVRKLQLGKGAIAAGVAVLRKLCGEEKIGGLLLAGGFGSFIRPESAARIGLIPPELLGVTRAIGNAAAQGAQMALGSREARKRLAALRENMHYQELSGMQEFNDYYIEEMMFPEED